MTQPHNTSWRFLAILEEPHTTVGRTSAASAVGNNLAMLWRLIFFFKRLREAPMNQF